jgi:predicted dehydrogenase
MTHEKCENNPSPLSRREVLQAGAVATAATAAVLSSAKLAYPAGTDRLRVGLIGCGGRGNGAVRDALSAAPGMEVVAIGDLFEDRVMGTLDGLKDQGEKNKVTRERAFHGWDNHQKVINAGVDYVILATPPGFRPAHLKAAIDAGKHVFMEKPVAVDAPGVRSVIASSEDAAKKKLGIVAGTQRRHQAGYVETIKRLRDGAIGDIVAAQVYWNQGGLWNHGRQPGWTDMEWQVRNWLYFTWLSGDHIVEQHVHNLDVANWAIGAHPEKALGMGGRQARTGPEYGHIYDHFTVEYEYPNGIRVMSMCRQIDNTASRVGERIAGTKGTSDPSGSIRGAERWRFEGDQPNPYVQEHTDLINSIRAGKPLNEGRQIAESTLTAIMGRMSAYTGQEVTWEQALNSRESLVPQKLAFGPLPVPPVAQPGKTQLA